MRGNALSRWAQLGGTHATLLLHKSTGTVSPFPNLGGGKLVRLKGKILRLKNRPLRIDRTT